ncbi:MAG: hypothetical protein KDM91_05795 [Verrucomicrobiae bacterium]|nr:hypothetical protein [Verrucomicrobiae bacterium]
MSEGNVFPAFLSFPALAAALASLASCGGGSKADTALPENPEVKATDPLSKAIEEFTGGHAKVAWVRHVGGAKSDCYTTGDKLQLWGVDTRDGKGERQLFPETGNVSRPLITPSGESVVYTSKNTRSKSGSKTKEFDPRVYRVDWKDGHVEELGEGHAVDVWRDPKTRIEWVYVTDLLPTEKASMYASRIERFKLRDPRDRETVYDKTRLSTENIQLSRDGTRACGLFPWPDAGVIDLPRGTHKKYEHGCWPSLAPDNSYYAWVFDGAHQNFFLFTDGAEKKWTVPVNIAPELQKHEVYHPRWSNHLRFFACTGPYTGATIGKSDGTLVEVFLSRFDEDIRSVEETLKITDNENGDFFPDLWVAHGEKTESSPVSAPPKPPGQPTPKREKRPWPETNLNLLFVWGDRNFDNITHETDPKARECGVEAFDRARYGPHYEMWCEGGWFGADETSSEAVTKYLAKPENPFTVEVVATPGKEWQDGVLLSTDTFQIKQRGSDLLFVGSKPKPVTLWIGAAKPGVPASLAVTWDGAEFIAYHNGKPIIQKDPPSVEMLAGRRGLTFGSGWAGSLERVYLCPNNLDVLRIAKNHEVTAKEIAARPPIPRVRLKAKLLEMTISPAPDDLDTYKNCLVAYLYEVEKVLEGEYREPKVLVMHWSILDRKPVATVPRRPGQSYELILEPKTSHPQLESELQPNETSEFIDEYYDVEPPQE